MLHKITIAVVCLFVLSSVCDATYIRDYSFEWDHNPETDNVITYRLYWREIDVDYDPLFSEDTGYTNQYTLYSVPGEYLCFACTAINDVAESGYSNQVCWNSVTGGEYDPEDLDDPDNPDNPNYDPSIGEHPGSPGNDPSISWPVTWKVRN